MDELHTVQLDPNLSLSLSLSHSVSLQLSLPAYLLLYADY